MKVCLDALLSTIAKSYELVEKPAGEFATAKVSGLTFQVKSFYAKGLGNVSIMSCKGMMGLMAMDTLVINPFELDAPLFSYDRIHAMGNDTLLLELYETRLDKGQSLSEVDSVRMAFDDIPNEVVPERWYKSITLPQSIKKKGKKALTPRFDDMVLKYLAAYIEVLGRAPACDIGAKTKAASVYTEGLLDNGGASTDAFLKAKGKEYTATLFRDYLFGTGEPK